MELIKKVEWVVFESGISGYTLEKQFNISQAQTSYLRKRKRKIENITLGVAENYGKAYDEYTTK